MIGLVRRSMGRRRTMIRAWRRRRTTRRRRRIAERTAVVRIGRTR